ncbi:MAG TPA: hypothetical protein VM598_05940 [Bdellovibrionota bacterium]|nr:hypothetical protein [Bdellovibrionota bacterium]
MRTSLTSIALLLSLTAAATACGSRAPAQRQSALDQFQYQPPYPGTGFGSSSGGSSSGSSSSGSGSSGSSGSSGGGTGIPALQMRVGTTGYNSVTVTVDVRKVLKVKFTPSVQDEVVAGSGFSPSYGRLGVYIQAGTITQATEMLSNGLFGQAQTSRVIDFSGGIDTGCAPTDLTCHAPVTIKVFKPNNDYFCMNFGQYCPWAQVYSTHPWHGTLHVQTDDTDPL